MDSLVKSLEKHFRKYCNQSNFQYVGFCSIRCLVENMLQPMDTVQFADWLSLGRRISHAVVTEYNDDYIYNIIQYITILCIYTYIYIYTCITACVELQTLQNIQNGIPYMDGICGFF